MHLPSKLDLSNRFGVYVLRCVPTGELYVGRTEQTLYERLARHLADAQKGRLGRLYDSMRQHGIENFELVGFVTCGVDRRNKPAIRTMENILIKRLKPALNVGYYESARKAGMSGRHSQHFCKGIKKLDCPLCNGGAP